MAAPAHPATQVLPTPRIPVDWPTQPHLLAAPAVATALGVDPALGLSTLEVDERRQVAGANRLIEPERRPAWRRFLDQFRSVLILVLIAAAVLAGLVGELKDTVVIAVVLLVNAAIGFVQEQRAERSLDALKRMLVPTARVRRDGAIRTVEAAELVPGDVVLLDAGDRVPADGRLLVAESVEVDESALTGESQPVGKSVAVVATSAAVPLAERSGMAFMNTTLTRGRAELLVTATGMQTEVGGIAAMLADGGEPPTPLQVQLDALGKRLALVGGIAVTGYAALAALRGESLGEIALRAVALAVATVPEGLPAVLALTLALGVHRMARRNAIVKRLATVETLGSATVVCSDKTGTLTLNEMTARTVVTAGREVHLDGERHRPDAVVTSLLTTVVLCNDAAFTGEAVIGDPTEAALLVAAENLGVDVDAVRAAHPRVAEVPFDSANKFMATFHAENGAVLAHVKGAPDVLLARCAYLVTDQGVVSLDGQRRRDLQEQVAALAARGLRVLGAATALLDGAERERGELADRLTGLTLLGLIGLADPPRPEARDAVALCRRAGVAVKMVTGDHAATAAAIAAEIGIGGEVVTGADLDRMPPDELAERIDDIGVFARVAPEHKVAIVRALTARGHVVAMTGDGVNDAAALRSAHIGVAMGITGTEVTKEAGDMILADDNFATIVRAVHEGRAIYDNIIKFVRFQLSTNMGAILTFLGASVAGLPAPLSAVQVLWVNIIMDGPPAMALGVDPPRTRIMDDPPRRQRERILSRSRLLRLLRAGLVMATGTLAVLALARDVWSEPVAATMAFTTFVLFQFFNALNARAERTTVFSRHLFTNRMLWLSLAAVLVLQVLAVHVPLLQAVFDTTALTGAQWAVCAAVASTILWVEEAAKLGARRR